MLCCSGPGEESGIGFAVKRSGMSRLRMPSGRQTDFTERRPVKDTRKRVTMDDVYFLFILMKPPEPQWNGHASPQNQ